MQCIESAFKGLEAAIEAAKGHTVDALRKADPTISRIWFAVVKLISGVKLGRRPAQGGENRRRTWCCVSCARRPAGCATCHHVRRCACGCAV